MSGAALALVIVSILFAMSANLLALIVVSYKLSQDYIEKLSVLRTSHESALDIKQQNIDNLSNEMQVLTAKLSQVEDAQVQTLVLIEELKLRGNTHGNRSQYVGPNGEPLNVVGAF